MSKTGRKGFLQVCPQPDVSLLHSVLISFLGNNLYGIADDKADDNYYIIKKLVMDQTDVKTCKFYRIKKVDGVPISNRTVSPLLTIKYQLFSIQKHFFAWFQQKCYVFYETKDEDGHVLELDLEREGTREICVNKCWYTRNMYMDTSGMLILGLTQEGKGQHVVRRMPLK